MISLPTLFILYNRRRKSFADPYCGFAYVKTTINESEGYFTALELLPQSGTFLISQLPTGSGPKQYFGTLQLKTYAPTTHPYKVIMDWTSCFNVHAAPGMPIIPVLEIVTRPREHFPKMIKRNLTFQLTDAIATDTKLIKIKQNAMSVYVARQLFELAKIKKDQCPITAKEFLAGETGVMPCGHLFTKLAIEESFKTNANKCPWCRYTGVPTYV